jgi:hypothetical protein
MPLCSSTTSRAVPPAPRPQKPAPAVPEMGTSYKSTSLSSQGPGRSQSGSVAPGFDLDASLLQEGAEGAGQCRDHDDRVGLHEDVEDAAPTGDRVLK